MLSLRFTRLTGERHRFAWNLMEGAASGTDHPASMQGQRELETRGFLLHDLIHLAVESEAGLTGGFYGGLAGYPADPAEAMAIERVVGVLTGWLKTRPAPEAFVAEVTAQMSETGFPVPSWFTPAFVQAVDARVRTLVGAWKATPYGGTLALTFPIPATPGPATGRRAAR